jgi:hypothetical protein
MGYCKLGYCKLGYCKLGYCKLGYCKLGYCKLGYCKLGYCKLIIFYLICSKVSLSDYESQKKRLSGRIPQTQPAQPRKNHFRLTGYKLK